MNRPTPYSGDNQFIFISYSHRDNDIVWPIIGRMIDDGYNVWYDDGIDPGTEWDEVIANKIIASDYFIAFISENYMASDNCKDELNYARDNVDNKLLIYLTDTSLPPGMNMRLGRIQAIQAFNFRKEDDFFKKLYLSKDINKFKDSYTEPQDNGPAASAGAVAVASVSAKKDNKSMNELLNKFKLIKSHSKENAVQETAAEVVDEVALDIAPEVTPEVAPEVIIEPAVPVAPVENAPIPVEQNVETPVEEAPVKDEPTPAKKTPSSKWAEWGVPGFRTHNKKHMIIYSIVYAISLILIGISLYITIDYWGSKYGSITAARCLFFMIGYIIALPFSVNYGFVQDKVFKLNEKSTTVKILTIVGVDLCIAVCMFLLLVLSEVLMVL